MRFASLLYGLVGLGAVGAQVKAETTEEEPQMKSIPVCVSGADGYVLDK